MRLQYCPCGCGELRRAPLPPRAAKLRIRRVQAEKAERIATQLKHAIELATAKVGGNA